MIKEKVHEQQKEASSENQNTLFLFNDEVNSFDFVIETLIDICGHESTQAEQCAMIAHYNGKCSVYTDCFDELLPLYNQLTEKGLTVQIC